MKETKRGSQARESAKKQPRIDPASITLVLLLAGCGSLWPFDNPEDPARCDPACSAPSVCKDGECEELGAYADNCKAGADCFSNICVKVGDRTACSQRCDYVACPGYDACEETEAGKICMPEWAKYAEPCNPPRCESGICVKRGDKEVCSQDCSSQPCPNDDQCVDTGSMKVCDPYLAKYGESCEEHPCESRICRQKGEKMVCTQECVTNWSCPNQDPCVDMGGTTLCNPS